MKKLLTILICLLLVPIITAYVEPDVIIQEEPALNWFQRLFGLRQYSAFGGSFSESTIIKGEYIYVTAKLNFLHDCEKYKLNFWFMEDTGKSSEMSIGTRIITDVKEYPHKSGDDVASVIRNIPTSQIPDSYCGKKIKGYVTHYTYYGTYSYNDGICHKSEPTISPDCISNTRLSYDASPTWHREEGSYLDESFTLKCVLPVSDYPRYVGSEKCVDGDVKKKMEYSPYSSEWITIEDCHNDGCSNGQCLEPCETGNIGSQFCKDNSVYQKVGKGRIGGQCVFEDELIESCSENQICDEASCIDQDKCGDGNCNNDETYNSCPEDCEKPWECGDNKCNSDEDEDNCCEDCGCSDEYTCIDSECQTLTCSSGDTETITCGDGTEIITHTCENNEWSETGNKCPEEECFEGDTQTKECDDETIITTHTCENNEWVKTENKCSGQIPSWLIPAIIGSIFLIGIVVILMSGKKKKGKKKK